MRSYARRPPFAARPAWISEADWELVLSGRHVDEIAERLKALNIYQYFFPPADQLALAVAERGVTKREDINSIIKSAPALGHPIAPNEILPSSASVLDIVEQLSEGSFVTEVDHAVTLTAGGTTSRLRIKATPRESAVSKLLNNFKINLRLSTKDLWPRP